VIVCDRSNTSTFGRTSRVLDLVLVVDIAAVADENRASELLVKHQTHLTLQPGNDIEIVVMSMMSSRSSFCFL
jgi:hypothetical protein